MEKAKPLSAQEVKKVILAFWHLNANKALIADFIPILAPDFQIQLQDKQGKILQAFRGLAGLQQHQDSKAPIFYDQKFILKAIKIQISKEQAIAKTIGQWQGVYVALCAAKTKKIKADLHHVWTIKRSAETNRAVIALHICNFFKYASGFAPTSETKDFHLEL